MSQPTEANLVTQWKDGTAAFEHLRKALAVNSPAWITDQDQLTADIGAFGNDFATLLQEAMGQTRARLDDALADYSNFLLAIALQYGAIMGVPEVDLPSLAARWYDWYVTNGFSIQSRQFAFGTPAAGGGNVGTGQLNALYYDENGYAIENQHADAKVAQCISDQTSGSDKNEELFEFRGAAAYPDALKITGSGKDFNTRVNARSARNSLLVDPSFSQLTLSGSNVTAFQGWASSVAVVGDGSDYTADTTHYYRDFPGDTTPTALNVKLTRTLTQTLNQTRATRLDPNKPYWAQVAWNAQVGGWTGTIQLNLGSQSASVTVVAQAGWNVLSFPVNTGTAGKKLWYKNWAQNLPTFSVAMTKTGGAGLLIDDVMLVPMDPFDGAWYTLMGSGTPWLRLDQWTWLHTEIGAVLQTWFWRATGRYVPALLPPTASAPTVVQSATAGAITAGNHKFGVTFEDAGGRESALSGVTGNVAFDGAHAADGSAVPVGPNAATVARRVYMTKAGGATYYYTGVRIADNSTTTFAALNVADAALTVAVGTGITYPDPA